MFARLITCSLMVASMLAAPAAFADPKRPYAQGRDYSRSGPAYDYARVLHVEPIVREVRVETPRRECWNEVRYEEPQGRHSDRGVAGPMILGGLIGGVIGHQFGRGDGNRAATVAGALIGSAVGHDAGARQQSRYAYSEPRSYSVERCDVRYEDVYEERIQGYDVEYEYGGERYRTRLPYDPGEKMRIRVDVRPADGY